MGTLTLGMALTRDKAATLHLKQPPLIQRQCAIKGKRAKASELRLGVEQRARAHANAGRRELRLCLRVEVEERGCW